jgi:hypothetical protein
MVLCAELSLSYLCGGVERLLHLSVATDHAADILSAFREAWCYGEAVGPFLALVRELTDLMLALHDQHLTDQLDIDWATEMSERDDTGDSDLLDRDDLADEDGADIVPLWPRSAAPPPLVCDEPVPF